MSFSTPNPVKAKLRQGKVSVGSWIQIGHPAIAEILSRSGFDWIAADMEHTDISIKEFTDIARGMYGRGSIPLARVRENSTMAIRQVLDAGAWGVIVPLVNSAEEAERAVGSVKFPPRGVRGTAFFRANEYGSDFDGYMKNSDRESLVIAMIETAAAVDNIDEILGVDGIDGIFIGPYDLSLSYGVPGKTDAPQMRDAKTRILRACKAAGKAAGIHDVRFSAESVAANVAEGFTFIALGMDTLFLERGRQDALGALGKAMS
jgi:2-keto-3-deoxy-L-rhamnonate aldolase RhmA